MRIYRNALLPILFLAGAAASPALHAEAQIVTDVAPPAPRAEIAPRPREGSIWSPGHWEWTGRSYLWVSGMWVLERHGAHWVAAQWDQVGTQWRYTRGHYER